MRRMRLEDPSASVEISTNGGAALRWHDAHTERAAAGPFPLAGWHQLAQPGRARPDS